MKINTLKNCISQIFHLANRKKTRSGAGCPTSTTRSIIEENEKLIGRIDQHIGLSKYTFSTYHFDVITRFANIMQRIPDPVTCDPLFITTLEDYLVLIQEKPNQNDTFPKDLFTYSILIALISTHICEALKTINIYYRHANKEFMWDPTSGALGDLCKTYRFEIVDQSSQDDADFNRVMIYSRLVSKKASGWLSSNRLISRHLKQFILSSDSIHSYIHCQTKVVEKESDVIEKTEKIVVFKKADAQTRENSTIQPKIDATTSTLDGYIAWLNNGIQSGDILINHRGARFHIVKEGLLLVAPFAFMDYEKNSGVPWKSVQNALLRKRWHLHNDKHQNFITYFIFGKTDKKVVHGVLIKNPENLLFGKVPQPSPYLNPA